MLWTFSKDILYLFPFLAFSRGSYKINGMKCDVDIFYNSLSEGSGLCSIQCLSAALNVLKYRFFSKSLKLYSQFSSPASCFWILHGCAVLQRVLLYLTWPLNPLSVSAAKPVIGREEGRALLILWLSMNQPLREQERDRQRNEKPERRVTQDAQINIPSLLWELTCL